MPYCTVVKCFGILCFVSYYTWLTLAYRYLPIRAAKNPMDLNLKALVDRSKLTQNKSVYVIATN